MAKVYAQVDPWFIQRGYKCTGVRDCRYAIRQNDLLFELHIFATPMPEELYSGHKSKSDVLVVVFVVWVLVLRWLGCFT